MGFCSAKIMFYSKSIKLCKILIFRLEALPVDEFSEKEQGFHEGARFASDMLH